MTTYSKETALYDTGAIATDIAEAGTKATNYITYIDEENGIRVYDGNNETIGSPASYAQLNAGGMDIITEEANVAHFGSDVRIGLSDGAKTVITSDGLSISSNEAVAIEVGSSSGNHGTWYYRKWKNGMIEAWYNMDAAVSVQITTSVANTYRGSRTITIPSGIFTSTPIFGNINTTQEKTTIHGNIRFVSNTQAEALFTRDASATVNVTASIYLMGYETT